MATNGRFKKALFGFRKSAVLDYVEEYQKDSRETIDALKKELAECQEQLAQANAVNAELESKLQECEGAVDELHSLAESLQAQVSEQAELHHRIGDVYVEAKADAKRILEDADSNAQNILQAAKDSTNVTLRQIDDTVSEMSAIKTSVDALAYHFGEKLSLIDSALSALRQKLSSAKHASAITSDELMAKGVLPSKKRS